MCDLECLFSQEICMYEAALNKLLKLGHNRDMIATNAMDESIQRDGRLFGVVAIICNSSIKHKLVKLIVLLIVCVTYYMVRTTHSQCCVF